MGKIIAIANQKGGVGKTTTAINLAACISVSEQKTLIIDLDPQANATTGLGFNQKDINNDPDYKTLYDLLISHIQDNKSLVIKDYIHPTSMPFLEVVPSNRKLAAAEVELISLPSVADQVQRPKNAEEPFYREKLLRDILQKLKPDYKFIFIDCPPSLGLLTINAFTAADSVLIPIQCEYYALEGLATLLNTINQVQRGLNPRLAIEGALLTMYDHRLNLSRQIHQDVKKCFSGKVFKSIIHRNVKLSEAPSFGKPIIQYDILSVGFEHYMKLAKEIMKYAK